MSKGARQRNKDKRTAKKKAIKATRKAQYSAFALAGKSKNSKRAVKGSRKKKLISSKFHPDMNCGNPGCARCFPQFAKKKYSKVA